LNDSSFHTKAPDTERSALGRKGEKEGAPKNGAP
jgi:hypothetical protein